MKILESADMEGATGVTWPADVEPGTEPWQRCRAMFTSDVNGAITGFFDGVAFVGYHTGAGTEGVLAHTYLPNSITGVWVNGHPASEGAKAATALAVRHEPVRGGPFTAVTTLISNAVERDCG